MKAIPFSVVVVALYNIFFSCVQKSDDKETFLEIHYPQPLPDKVPITFLPNIVSKEGLDFNSAFSPDGNSFYFTRSKNRQWDIYIMTHNGTGWSEPMLAPFSDPKYSEADPAFSPDGKLYFISNRPKDSRDTIPADFDIWFIRPMPSGRWTEPENFNQINSDSAEYYISFARSGNIYFGSSRQGGYGAEDIYVSRLINGQYAKPENLGAAINTSQSEHDPCIWPNEEFLVFKSENRGDGYGEADLYCTKFTQGAWTQSVNLGDKFNTKTYEYCPYLTPDSKYFFFSSEYEIKWADANLFKNHIEKLTSGK